MAETKDLSEIEIQEELKSWVEYPRQHIEELKKQATERGLDPKKVAQSYMIDVIAYDDANTFGPAISYFSPKNGRLSKLQYLGRVDWEITVEELPQEIKERVESVRNELEGKDWESEDGIKGIYQTWNEKVKLWVEDYISQTNPELKRAFDEYLTREGRIRKENRETATKTQE